MTVTVPPGTFERRCTMAWARIVVLVSSAELWSEMAWCQWITFNTDAVHNKYKCTSDPELCYLTGFLAHSQACEWATSNRAASVVCPSVCPSVNFCANRFYYDKNGSIATKLAQGGLQVSAHPGCAQGQGQRSRDTGTFVLARKSPLLPGKKLMVGLRICYQTCTRWSPGTVCITLS